ncbi:alpha,alpha-trehalose-phosphate synthase (UDP-forming) [Propioniciclava soli]|uniref:Trehalose-6-phosphate synthase n=1 Tax=Propioniciclava soli TaxID=2775081 RepID=A0ABZ3C656_9ACTN|nr:trehalose-6-phosphate synthase [Propioniciclava soli]
MTTSNEAGTDTPRAALVVVANRLAVERTTAADGSAGWQTSPGGLVTALVPIMQAKDGAWVGWHGAPDEELEPFHHDGIDMIPVALSAGEVEEYYEGMSNATFWPLYHDSVAFPEFHREWWDAYVAVNRRFAEAAASAADDNGTVWVQDYQLQLVPSMLREMRPDLRIGFFLHIPFPPSELFQQLPWRRAVLEGLAGADLVGFQVPGAATNFLNLLRRRLGWDTHRQEFVRPDGSRGRAAAYPISIATQAFEDLANSPEVVERAAQIREDLAAETVFLGVDRLDYTKGLRQRVRAFGELFTSGELDPEKVVFVQVATPSRERVEEYKRLRDDIELLVGRINGDSGQLGRPPIHYLHQSFPRDEMAALYRAADVMVVTPLRDGMNLVAKEYVACRSDNDGALVLSEFAGAARELKQAWQVNPYDIDGMKEAILAAGRAGKQETRRRMRALRKQVATHDIDHWAETFLADLDAI